MKIGDIVHFKKREPLYMDVEAEAEVMNTSLTQIINTK
jgi:hypothetical protein